jgi:hypothetical protein
MAAPIVLSPDTAYATKTNIVFPGTVAQATAARAAAKTRIEDTVPGITVTVAAGSIVGS